MAENIANEDLQVNFVNSAGPPDIVYSGDQGIDPVKIVPTKATKAKCNSKFICTTSIVLTWTAGTPCPHTSATHTFVSGAGSITAGSTKVKCDNNFVLLKEDSGTCAGTWAPPSGPNIPCACTIKIADAGQTNVSGN